VKTTLEIPDALFRQVKARAATNGQSMKVLVVDALRASMREPAAKEGSPSQPAWLSVYGALRHEKTEIRKIQSTIDEEFGKINPEDWK
jgi:hypothetical protein